MAVCAGYGDKVGKCKNSIVNEKTSKYCKNCAGKSFEDEIAYLFSIQGYSVHQNLKVSGTQHDFYAKLDIGPTSFRILAECKFKFNEEEKVNSQDVKKLHASFDMFNLRGIYGPAEKAMLITNGGFAPEALEVAHSFNIELKTLDDILKNLINFDHYFDSIIETYEMSELNEHYIKLADKDGNDLNEAVERYFKKSPGNALALLGDYGTGKTSYCTWLRYQMVNKRKNGLESRIPILIQLRDYNKAIDLEQVITNRLVNDHDIINANIRTFKELLNRGYFLLMFDGFDEAAQRVDYSTKFKIYNEICKFVVGESKVLVTSRTNFFNQRDEFERIFKLSPVQFEPMDRSVTFEEIEIGDLSRAHTEEYINTFRKLLSENKYNVQMFMEVMTRTHDLSDLARRPVLLNMMIKTIPKMSLNKGNINSVTLYKQYTDQWLYREDSKGKTLIRSEEKSKFIRKLAWKMFTTNSLSVHYSKIHEEVVAHFHLDRYTSEGEHFSHDIQSCSFLNRVYSDRIRPLIRQNRATVPVK